MTLRCRCGGSVELQSQSYGNDMAFESYRCVECNATGTYRFDEYGDEMQGCLVDA